MAKWFAAHLVMYVKPKERLQEKVTVWENIVLIKAQSEEEAFLKANQRGKDDAGDDDGTFRWNGVPAEWVFAGIRKLTCCDDPNRRPDDGTELSYIEMQVDSEQNVYKLVRGEPVPLMFKDRFASELVNCDVESTRKKA